MFWHNRSAWSTEVVIPWALCVIVMSLCALVVACHNQNRRALHPFKSDNLNDAV